MKIQGVAHGEQAGMPAVPDGVAGTAVQSSGQAGGAVAARQWTGGDRLTGNCVMLVAGSLQILVPQQDVVYTGYQQTGALVAGALAVSEDLLLLPAVPPECFVYTAFADAPDVYWCWNDVRVLIDLDIALYPLPEVVTAPNTPLAAVLTLPDGSHAFYTRGARLSHFVRQQVKAGGADW